MPSKATPARSKDSKPLGPASGSVKDPGRDSTRPPRFDPAALAAVQGESRERIAGDFDLAPETWQRLGRYVATLTDWQTRMNLVAPSTLGIVWERHIADSLQLVDLLPPFEVAVDLGSGGGLPGIVMAIARPEAKVHLIESVGKKASFLRAVADELDLNTHIHARRIESCGSALKAADVVTARALASLDKLCALVAPHLNSGARCFFAKGASHEAELALARETWSFQLDKHPSKLEAGSVILEIASIRPRRAR